MLRSRQPSPPTRDRSGEIRLRRVRSHPAWVRSTDAPIGARATSVGFGSGAISVLPVLTPRPTRLNGFDFGTGNTEIAPDQLRWRWWADGVQSRRSGRHARSPAQLNENCGAQIRNARPRTAQGVGDPDPGVSPQHWSQMGQQLAGGALLSVSWSRTRTRARCSPDPSRCTSSCPRGNRDVTARTAVRTRRWCRRRRTSGSTAQRRCRRR